MKRMNIKTNCLKIACALLMGTQWACSDDFSWSGNKKVEEGLPATVTLNLSIEDVGERSRSIIDDEQARNYCANIWVGVYDSETGERLAAYYNTDVANTNEEVNEKYELTFAAVSSNHAYIVAVANSDVNSGVDNVNDYAGKDSDTSTLRDMLDEADTWQKFTNICMLRPDASDVNIYANTLTMSGWYAESSDKAQSISDLQPVVIEEGDNTMSGAIYLRRVIAYNKFTIVPGDNVNLTLNTWRVCNVPAGCYLFEGSDNVADKAGSDVQAKFYNSSLESHQFTATTTDEGKKGHYFEFYQVENKHTAIDYVGTADNHVGINPEAANPYTERESEFKTDAGLNTGAYRSLVNSATAADMSNNYASYVVVNATIDYYIPYSDDPSDLENANPVDPTQFEGKTIHRTAKVDYTIHLGYCEGETTADKATDFNCKRNTRYNYTAIIKGVKNVVLEARKQGENQPGAEGWVTDETGEFEELDSHYCEFNICLTDAERKKMTYRITAPYNGQYYYRSRDVNGDYSTTDNMDPELYDWIKFYPTSDENTLAEYYGGKGKNSLGEGTGLWTFDDMCEPTVTTNPYKSSDETDPDDTPRWYTVFVDEYVYHFDDKGGKETSWPYYCNQDDRMAEFIMNIDQSTDTESSYTYCKYAFAQKSIQTYYKGEPDENGNVTGIGVEHYEETYCMNMNWYPYYTGFADEHNRHDYDYTNGRYNIFQYLYPATFINSDDDDQHKDNRVGDDKKWSDMIQATVPAHVTAGSYKGTTHPAADYPVYMPGDKVSPSGNRPNSENIAYNAKSICMNRNRNSGTDDKIEYEDVKWYLPTSDEYVQIAIAQSELPDPIMRFTDYSPSFFVSGWLTNTQWDYERFGTYNYHYITSNYQYYWAEQAVNMGDYPFNGYNGGSETATHTARCVRHLGTDLKQKPEPNVAEVGNAFKYDANTRTFSQYNFTDNALRGYSPSGIAPHDTSSPSAKPYRKFQVAKNFSNASDSYVRFTPNMSYVSASTDNEKVEAWTLSIEKNGICGQYSEKGDKSDKGEWRVPSAYELALMCTQGLPQADNCFFYSSTHDYFTSWIFREYDSYNAKYLGYQNDGNRRVMALDILGHDGSVKLRCVRDVR